MANTRRRGSSARQRRAAKVKGRRQRRTDRGATRAQSTVLASADQISVEADNRGPRPPSAAIWDRQLDRLLDVADEWGIDTASVKAGRDVGFFLTEANQHLFSRAQIEEWQGAVDRYWREEEAEAFADHLRGLVVLLTQDLEEVVGRTVADHDKQAAQLFNRRVLAVDVVSVEDYPDFGPPGSIAVCLALLWWCKGIRAEFDGADLVAAAVAWIESHLGTDTADTAGHAAVFLTGAALTEQASRDLLALLGPEGISTAATWLLAGVVATRAAGDTRWLRQYDPGWLRR